ncbi:hypothetical protein AJ79_03630 [Helicocarpus griseus UAMH5409]|uniref:Rab-GAP TBC domain-containing protein n=1 Tax=Helicocarpus griseus UAMH5409 TaxID=1447875 RepID=A0A2B7XWW4_9EURO|nr:hypothetical protein AJ79_03630 [Helicocarpus griseus UAMH5409]
MEPTPDSPMETRSSVASACREPLPTDSMVTVPLSEDAPFSPKTPDSINRASNAFSSPIAEAPQDTVERGDGYDGRSENEVSPGRESKDRPRSTKPFASINFRNSGGSNAPESPEESDSVDWEGLEKSEESESKSDPGDESTALLLARLEQENNALVGNPKSGSHVRKESRPPSIHQLRKLVDDPSRSSLRFSQLPTPSLTELDFWAALVADYAHTAQRLPTLTSNKIRAGVPPPLRGVVWPSIACARDADLLEEFERLSGESSPYEGAIGKDIGRSFPNVDMFRDPNGEGQQMLLRVLKCFSLYDDKIGYCQGLGFVVGPLLMHMSDAEAFCVLVRLMDHYDLRSCFLPDLSGLHLRIYQFQTLLSRHLPKLHAHFDSLEIEPVYVSQWFLSFFAATCPLPMLLRIYDVLLLEGACETLMRVALSLMQRNEAKLLECQEDGAMSLLLSRGVWDTYGFNPDSLVQDFVSLTSLVTRESLQELERSYKESQSNSSGVYFPKMQATASSFLGRLWAGSGSYNSTRSLAVNPATPSLASRPSSIVRRTPSKQSMASTLNSFESTSDASTAPTESSSTSNSAAESSKSETKTTPDKDNQNTQIEEGLLLAFTDMERKLADLKRDLEREREKRGEDQQIAKLMLERLKEHPGDERHADLVDKATSQFSTEPRQDPIDQTKPELMEEIKTWKEKHRLAESKCKDLSRRLDEQETHCQLLNRRLAEQEMHCQNISERLDKQEVHYSGLKDELKETRSRVQEAHKEKQRLERMCQELRARKDSSRSDSPHQSPISTGLDDRGSSGLREFKLCRSGSTTSTFSKRSSSLGAQATVSSDDSQAAPEDLARELAHVKLSEAVARQELDEVKAKLDSLRKLMSRSADNSPSRLAPTELTRSATVATLPSSRLAPKSPTEPAKASTAAPAGGIWPWSRRTPSTSSTAR